MKTDYLLTQLKRYERFLAGIEGSSEEAETIGAFSNFVTAYPRCLERSHALGHVTASAFVIDPDCTGTLMTRHKKLNRWLQLGGHVDGASTVSLEALREAKEESGLDSIYYVPIGTIVGSDSKVFPLDIDIHEIPSTPTEPRHLHYDVRYLLWTPIVKSIRASPESHELRFIPFETLKDYTMETSIQRPVKKILSLFRSAAHDRNMFFDALCSPD